jgi:hypothetical protein
MTLSVMTLNFMEIKHNTQHNDTMAAMLNVVYADCHLKAHAECCCAECLGTTLDAVKTIIV